MSEAVLVALITGGISLVGTVLTILATTKKTEESMRISQAVMEQKITDLTREVRSHNSFAQRLPVVEEQIKVINHRIDDLEEANKK